VRQGIEIGRRILAQVRHHVRALRTFANHAQAPVDRREPEPIPPHRAQHQLGDEKDRRENREEDQQAENGLCHIS
jgi:hypothetical protein